MDTLVNKSSDTPDNNIDQAIGSSLRDLRESRKLSARQLAQTAGVSAAMISRVENGQVSPSISTMTSLASALDVPLVSLFRDTGATKTDFTHVKKGTGISSTRIVDDHIHHYLNLASHRRRDINFEAHMVTIKRQDALPPRYIGHGVVFLYVISGKANYLYGKQQLLLAAGDCLSIDAELIHGFGEILAPQLVFLSVQAESR